MIISKIDARCQAAVAE